MTPRMTDVYRSDAVTVDEILEHPNLDLILQITTGMIFKVDPQTIAKSVMRQRGFERSKFKDLFKRYSRPDAVQAAREISKRSQRGFSDPVTLLRGASGDAIRGTDRIDVDLAFYATDDFDQAAYFADMSSAGAESDIFSFQVPREMIMVSYRATPNDEYFQREHVVIVACPEGSLTVRRVNMKKER